MIFALNNGKAKKQCYKLSAWQPTAHLPRTAKQTFINPTFKKHFWEALEQK
jgi:hypothetical protein